MASLKEGIQARREHSPDSAQVRTVLARDKEAMDAIRKVAARMREQGQTSLADVGVATRRQLTRTQVLGLVIGFLGIGAGLFALYLVRVGYFQERTSQELLEGKLLAEKTAVEKTVFLANISHEIRTPMNAILGFSELLEGESLSNRQSQYVRSIQQSGRSLLQLVSDVLDLSRLEAGKLELRLEPTDLGEICNFLQTMFIQQATVKSLALGFEVNGIACARC
jgi:signal transduction histidine kinase